MKSHKRVISMVPLMVGLLLTIGGGNSQATGIGQSAAALVAASAQVPSQSVAAVWSGWSEVPGAGRTVDSPATVTFNGQQYLFVRGTDNRIYRNIDTAGSWTGWSEIPGAGTTYSAPSAAVYGNQLYVFVRGVDNRIYLNILRP
jgi:hypothetical protein